MRRLVLDVCMCLCASCEYVALAGYDACTGRRASCVSFTFRVAAAAAAAGVVVGVVVAAAHTTRYIKSPYKYSYSARLVLSRTALRAVVVRVVVRVSCTLAPCVFFTHSGTHSLMRNNQLHMCAYNTRTYVPHMNACVYILSLDRLAIRVHIQQLAQSRDWQSGGGEEQHKTFIKCTHTHMCRGAQK